MGGGTSAQTAVDDDDLRSESESLAVEVGSSTMGDAAEERGRVGDDGLESKGAQRSEATREERDT